LITYQQDTQLQQPAPPRTEQPVVNLGAKSIPHDSAFRPRIMQTKDTVPAYLRSTPKKAVVNEPITLTHTDSLALNLVPYTEFPGDYLSQNALTDFVQENKSKIYHSVKPEEPSSARYSLKGESITDIINYVTRKEIGRRDTTHILHRSEAPIKVRKIELFDGQTDWLAAFIVMALLLAGAIKIAASKYLNELFSAVIYKQAANKLFSTINAHNQKPALGLNILFFITSSLLVYEYAVFNGMKGSFGFYSIILGGITGYYLLKNAIYSILAYIFETQSKTDEYLYSANILTKTYGLAILPIVAVIPFINQSTMQIMLQAGLILFVIMYILQMIRGFRIILSTPLSMFYMFLYFCALEIIPIAMLIKSLML